MEEVPLAESWRCSQQARVYEQVAEYIVNSILYVSALQ